MGLEHLKKNASDFYTTENLKYKKGLHLVMYHCYKE